MEVKVQKANQFPTLEREASDVEVRSREQGGNVVATMLRLREVVDSLNANELTARGLNLRIVYDETGYISSALSLVKQNIWIGGILRSLS